MKFLIILMFTVFICSCTPNTDLCECSYGIPDLNSENGVRIETIDYDCEIGAPTPCI
ncbi:hypothetical protein [uncultured Polaribacter sp.]|uniref:hypothetical protein n=1 Tax=uncultured Polaribacter sp. TaxID=174711 RepID=UPI002620651F|nr:hypothetical protein [uncultured Polaribacter sp.]